MENEEEGNRRSSLDMVNEEHIPMQNGLWGQDGGAEIIGKHTNTKYLESTIEVVNNLAYKESDYG